MNRLGGDTGIDADFNITNRVIYIDGYWLDTNETFKDYKCVIGAWDGNENDWGIFYYFETLEELESFKNVKGRTDSEFVITKIRGV